MTPAVAAARRPIAPDAHAAAPRLRPARLEDYGVIAAVARENGLAASDEREWRRLWLENPLWPRLGYHWTIGWVLEDGGRVVGSIVSVPSLYVFEGREIVAANGRAWNVLPSYRGLALWLMEEYLTQRGVDLFVNTTVGPMATAALDTVARRTPAGEWTRVAFWVTGRRALAERVLARARVPCAPLLARPAALLLRLRESFTAAPSPSADASVTIDEARGFDAAFDAFWDELRRSRPGVLLGVRNRRTLAWHFAAAQAADRIRVFTATRNRRLRAYAIVVLDRLPLGIERARLVDYQTLDGDRDPLPALIDAIRRRCARDGTAVLEHHGCGLPKFRAFDDRAPHHRTIDCWPHYYQTTDRRLATALEDPAVWDPSLYDGDATF